MPEEEFDSEPQRPYHHTHKSARSQKWYSPIKVLKVTHSVHASTDEILWSYLELMINSGFIY